MITKKKLLKELEGLPHDGRMRHMVTFGQNAKNFPQLKEVLDERWEGGSFERRLALAACFGSRDGERVVGAVGDRSRVVRGLALRLVHLCCDDLQASGCLEMLRAKDRRILMRRLRRHDRLEPIDRFLERLAGREDPDFPELLGYGSKTLVEKYVEQALEQGGLALWARLGRIHPEFACQLLSGRVAEGEEIHPRVSVEVLQVLAPVARSRPELAISLMRDCLEHGVRLGSPPAARLARWNPAGVADLILSHTDAPRLPLAQAAHRLEQVVLMQLLERAPGCLQPVGVWFKKLDPLSRLEVFRAREQALQNQEGCLEHEVLGRLPGGLREKEARRHLDLPALATRTEQRLSYATYLPFEEVFSEVEPFLSHPDADLRQAALYALVGAVRYHPDQLPRVLQILKARKHEQDPVRMAFMMTLSTLPPTRWLEEHLDDLGQVLRNALDATDLSPTTAVYAQKIVVDLLPLHPKWSSEWLRTLVQERGNVSLYGLDRRLAERDVRVIAPILAPVFKSWESRERQVHILNVAVAFGRRLEVFGELAESLDRVLSWTKNSWMANQALACLRAYQRPLFEKLVPRLLKEDPSFVTVGSMLNYLHERRQDLLTPYLGETTFKGRFSTGRTVWVMPLYSGFFRWTPGQQETFADVLDSLTRERKRDNPSLMFAVDQLAALPDVPPKALISRARSTKPVVRDAALRALARVDGGKGVDELVAALNDERARIAIYALRGAVMEMPEPAAVELLKKVPLDQVTVAKEVARLLGELRSDEAFAGLMSFEAPDLHRDIRVALLRALWGHLHRQEAWRVLDEAAVSPEAAVAASLAQVPDGRLNRDGFTRLSGLLNRLLDHPEPRVRMAVLKRCAASPVADPDRSLLGRLLGMLGSRLPDERISSAHALFQSCRPTDAPVIKDKVSAILHDRKAIQSAVHSLANSLGARRSQLLRVGRAVIETLSKDKLTASLRVVLAAQVFEWPKLSNWLGELAGRGELHADALVQCMHSLHPHRPDSHRIEELEAALFDQPLPELRRIALAVLVVSAGIGGWTDERRERLEKYRGDPDPLVAEAAQFTFPPEAG